MSLYESLAPLFDGFFPIDRRAPSFLDSLSRSRSIASGPRALDAGCATGGHALALAELGWTCLGIDSEEAMIKLAVAAAWREGLAERASFVVGDIAAMDGLVGEASFDLALCLGNTLPHLGPPRAEGQTSDAEREAGAAAFLERTLALLAPGGSVVLQMMNYARPGLGPGYVFPELRLAATPRDGPAELSAQGAIMRRRYDPVLEATGSLRFLVELALDGRTQVSETRLVPLVPGQVESVLLRTGFQAIAFYSGWDGGPFDERRDSFFIAVAVK